MLYLYLISQNENNDYDTYDSAVVVASSEDEARKIHPDGENGRWDKGYWTSSPEKVRVYQIGIANSEQKAGDVVCASFNSGG